ncbi:MAG: hypothetical protein AAB907_02465, partial [Patescibacteria group bacterium]
FLNNGNACEVIEIQASNFALLSGEEQQAKIYAYASFLNSLSFSIQIIIRNKKIDISSYINLINQQHQGASTFHAGLSEQQNLAVQAYILQYKDFISELVKVNSVLAKSFYVVIPYSYLEKGVTGSISLDAVSSALKTKTDTVVTQLSRLSLKAKILDKEDLVRLFYDIYNPNNSTSASITEGIGAPIVRGGQK